MILYIEAIREGDIEGDHEEDVGKIEESRL